MAEIVLKKSSMSLGLEPPGGWFYKVKQAKEMQFAVN